MQFESTVCQLCDLHSKAVTDVSFISHLECLVLSSLLVDKVLCQCVIALLCLCLIRTNECAVIRVCLQSNVSSVVDTHINLALREHSCLQSFMKNVFWTRPACWLAIGCRGHVLASSTNASCCHPLQSQLEPPCACHTLCRFVEKRPRNQLALTSCHSMASGSGTVSW